MIEAQLSKYAAILPQLNERNEAMGKDGEGVEYDDDHRFDSYDDDYGDDRCDMCGLTFDDGCTCDECGLQPDGTCLLAGTEHCDWDCTVRR